MYFTRIFGQNFIDVCNNFIMHNKRHVNVGYGLKNRNQTQLCDMLSKQTKFTVV